MLKKKLTPQSCPACGRNLVAATKFISMVNRKKPVPRRLWICWHCKVSVILHSIPKSMIKPLSLPETSVGC